MCKMYHSTESNITDIYLYKVQLNKEKKLMQCNYEQMQIDAYI